MGWLKLQHNQLSGPTQDTDATPAKTSGSKSDAVHIEAIDEPGTESPIPPPTPKDETLRPSQPPLPFADAATPNDQLPFISASRVAAESSRTNTNSQPDERGENNNRRRLWIVIDAIVYDCTDFARSQHHPGGAAPIEQLAGGDCSWQFWRFHAAEHLRDYGWGLRVARTAGVRNKFGEKRPRYVGLRGLDSAQDW
ncbi:Cytochrome b5 [Lasiodiplodia theobromae]|uniref:Putative cytochrome b5 n=1 Tax=Lasiodiplodia theobromae TaxID=45133 RepID=A0A5N5DN26_9PEZI|nr:putative cytochrome b5 [Lasiodiplodia theobromae]KAF9637856.1 Cytochrome b5 [Lasiodiplodia theobromae]